jgi:hypothetical protein
LTGDGALSGASTLVFSPTATLIGDGALSGASSITFDVSGTLVDGGAGAMSGSSSLTFSTAGVLTGFGALAGSSAIVFDVTGVLTGAEDSTDQPVTGGGWWPDYEYARRFREKRAREIDELEREKEQIADAISREIYALEREQERKEADKADLVRLQRLADQYAGRVKELPQATRLAILNAQDQRTQNSLEQMRRMIERTILDEDIAVLMILLNDD